MARTRCEGENAIIDSNDKIPSMFRTTEPIPFPNLYRSEIAITYFFAGAAHSIIRRSKGSPRESTIGTIHITAIITRVYHGVSAPLYLLGWQVPNTMYHKGKKSVRGRRASGTPL